MIQENTLQFFVELKENNSKEWFDKNRKNYETARKNFIDFATIIVEGISKFDESIAASGIEAKKTMMRINRDIRFSKDKTPYNTHFFSSISKGGKSSYSAGYYVSLSPSESFYGAGIYKPDTATINMIRQEIDYNPTDWKEIVEDEALKSHFGEIQTSGQLSRPPKGYSKEHLLLDWLKRKDHFLKKDQTDKQVLSQAYAEQIVNGLKTAYPLVQFLNRGIDA